MADGVHACFEESVYACFQECECPSGIVEKMWSTKFKGPLFAAATYSSPKVDLCFQLVREAKLYFSEWKMQHS